MTFVKKGAEDIAKEVWAELGIAHPDVIDIQMYAESLGIPVFTIGSLSNIDGLDVAYFKGVSQSKLSAYTIMFGFQERVIFYNDAHHIHRQRSSIAHELAHALLMHEPTSPLTSNGARNFDRPMEEEADFLGAALLVPRPRAIQAAKQKLSDDEVAEDFNVSAQLAGWRMGISGARTIAQRTNRKYGR